MGNNFYSKTLTYSTEVKTTHGYPPDTLRFSPDGKTLIACFGWDGVFFWHVTRPYQPPHIFKPKRPKYSDEDEQFLSVDVSPVGKYFILSSDVKRLRLWHLGYDIPYVTFPLRSKPATAAAYNHAAQLIAYQDIENRINMYDFDAGSYRKRYKVDANNTLNRLTFSPNGRYLVSAPCCIYDTLTCKIVDGFTNDGFKFQAFSNDSMHFWDAADQHETLTLWNIPRGEEIRTLQKPTPPAKEERYVASLVVSQCQQYLACCLYTYEQKIRIHLYDLNIGDSPATTFEVAGTGACPLAFSPDSTRLACVTAKNLYIWDLRKPYTF